MFILKRKQVLRARNWNDSVDGNMRFRPVMYVVTLFKETCNDPNHKLYQLLPPFDQSKINLRSKRTFSVKGWLT